MIPPDTAEQARRALIAWGHHLRTTGQPIPDGWGALCDLYAACARHTPTLLPLDAAAERAGISLRTLRRWRADGLPTVRRGGRLLVPTTDLDRWADR